VEAAVKSIVYALIGIVCYAITNTIIDVRLKQYSTISLLVGWYIVLFPLTLGLYLYQRSMGAPTRLPSGNDLSFLVLVAMIYFIADYFYIGAFTVGGTSNVVTITILLVLMPVIAALIKFVWVKESPTPYHFAAFACALLAVLFVAMGDLKKPVELRPAIPTLQSSAK
jgi:drug/metabolite transporter (DMT)-like permease